MVLDVKLSIEKTKLIFFMIFEYHRTCKIQKWNMFIKFHDIEYILKIKKFSLRLTYFSEFLRMKIIMSFGKKK